MNYTALMLLLCGVSSGALAMQESKGDVKTALAAAAIKSSGQKIAKAFSLYPVEFRKKAAHAHDGALFQDWYANKLCPVIEPAWYADPAQELGETDYMFYVPATTQAIHDLFQFSETLTNKGEQFLKALCSYKLFEDNDQQSQRIKAIVESDRLIELYALVVLLKIEALDFLKDVVANKKQAATQNASFIVDDKAIVESMERGCVAF